MTASQWVVGACAAIAVAACAPQPPPSVSAAAAPAASPGLAAGFDPGPVRTAAEYLADDRFRTADLARGELLSLACAACHTLAAGQGTLVGPNLHGVFGRQAARVPGFAYSPALQGAELVWTPVSLEAWLAEPARFVVGTTMTFSGYRSADDRRDLIAYLLRATQ